MKNYISRPLYIKRIEPFIDKNIIKVITGQRRIGKSYILLQISDIIKKNIPEANIIFVDKEQLSFTEIRNYMDLYQYVLKKVIALCSWYNSTIRLGTASSLNMRSIFSKLPLLSSSQHNSHSVLILGSCLNMALQMSRYCLSSPFVISRAKRLYSSLCVFFQ